MTKVQVVTRKRKMKKLLKVLTICLLVLAMCVVAAGCNKGNDGGNGGNAGTGDNSGNNGGTQDPTSVIESLTAVESSTTVKVGESILITNFYELKGTSTLNASQRACTYVSSNPDVVAINAKRAEAVAPGTATITITSSADSTKSCSFEVVVEGVFIDRDLTTIPSEDDFSKEWNNELGTGSFQTSSGITNFYFIDGIKSTQWYVETDITLNSVNWDDRWPKMGIFAQIEDENGDETMVTFFLNASIGLYDYADENGNHVNGEDNVNWNEFGVCEVYKGHWAWEQGITNSLARHHDYAWTIEDTITYSTTFKLGVARDGANFHVYVNGNYVGSYQLSADLTILCENGQPVDSYVGFYQFASDVTFSNYSATTDAAAVAAKVPAEPIYTEFLED